MITLKQAYAQEAANAPLMIAKGKTVIAPDDSAMIRASAARYDHCRDVPLDVFACREAIAIFPNQEEKQANYAAILYRHLLPAP